MSLYTAYAKCVTAGIDFDSFKKMSVNQACSCLETEKRQLLEKLFDKVASYHPSVRGGLIQLISANMSKPQLQRIDYLLKYSHLQNSDNYAEMLTVQLAALNETAREIDTDDIND